MKLAGTLLSYALAIGALCAGLTGGVMLLLQPGAATSPREARAAAIPPRIADSIERKKPIPVTESEPAPAKPVMTEANVSLTPAPSAFKTRELAPPPKQKRKPRGETAVAAPAAPIHAAAPVVSTARSDVPY